MSLYCRITAFSLDIEICIAMAKWINSGIFTVKIIIDDSNFIPSLYSEAHFDETVCICKPDGNVSLLLKYFNTFFKLNCAYNTTAVLLWHV